MYNLYIHYNLYNLYNLYNFNIIILSEYKL